MHRRHFLKTSFACWSGFATFSPLARASADDSPARIPIIDTHQHLWDLSWQQLPWLKSAPKVLKRSYTLDDYREAMAGLPVSSIYMEVDVAENQLMDEVAHVVALCREPDSRMHGAVVGGRPEHEQFPETAQALAKEPEIRGVRRILHGPTTPAGYCLQPTFIQGVQSLGTVGLSFDLCMRPQELAAAHKLAKQCPDTQFILDHCGNADPRVFGRDSNQPSGSHSPDAWRKDIDKLAALPNVVCKISGIVAKAPRDWTADDLAPIVNHCLDAFGPDRVIFGSDWPVCLLRSSPRDWIAALTEIISERPKEEQRKLWNENAKRLYRIG